MGASSSPSALPGLAILEQTPIIIEKMLSAATGDQLHWKPSKDRWSIGEVLAHLADVEAAVFRPRIQRMLDEKDPLFENYDQEAASAAGKYSSGEARERLKEFCHERDRSLSLLRYAPASLVSRTGRHSLLGPITAGQVMNAWASHDLGHVRQIAELYRACAFFPLLGPFQRCYTLKP
jgi:hypothetical protein